MRGRKSSKDCSSKVHVAEPVDVVSDVKECLFLFKRIDLLCLQ